MRKQGVSTGGGGVGGGVMASFPLRAGPFDPAGTTWRLKAHLQREAADSLARETREGDARARAVPAYPSRLGDFDCGAVPPASAAGTPAAPAPTSSPPRVRLGSTDTDVGAAAAARGSSGYLAALREQGPPSPAVSATRAAADAASTGSPSSAAAAVPPSNGAGGGGGGGGGGGSNAAPADAFLLSIQQLQSRARMGVVAQALHDLQPVPYEVPRFPPHEPAPLSAAATQQQPAASASSRLRTPLSHTLQPQPHACTQGGEHHQPDTFLALSPSLSTGARRFGADSPSLLQSPSPPRQQRQQQQQQPQPTSDLATLVSECLGADSEEDERLLFRAVFGSTPRERRRRADGRAARRPARGPRAREAAFASPPDVVKAAVRMGLRSEPENVAPMVEVLAAVDVGGGVADVAAAAAAAAEESSSSGDRGAGGGSGGGRRRRRPSHSPQRRSVSGRQRSRGSEKQRRRRR